MSSVSVENYLKAMYHLSEGSESAVQTSALAAHMNISPASVSEMLGKLCRRELAVQLRHGHFALSSGGLLKAAQVVRNHRLWEVFLYTRLGYAWHEVHDLAEQLEHVSNPDLITRLEAFLGHPQTDPHGDPIPDIHGNIAEREGVRLSQAPAGLWCRISGLLKSDAGFLLYLDELGIRPGTELKVLRIHSYDHSMQVSINKRTVFLTEAIASSLLFIPHPEKSHEHIKRNKSPRILK